MNELFEELDKVKTDDLEEISKLGKRIRENLNSIPMPDDKIICL